MEYTAGYLPRDQLHRTVFGGEYFFNKLRTTFEQNAAASVWRNGSRNEDVEDYSRLRLSPFEHLSARFSRGF